MFGEIIRKERLLRKLTISKVCYDLSLYHSVFDKITEATYYRWETGKSPMPLRQVVILDYFGLVEVLIKMSFKRSKKSLELYEKLATRLFNSDSSSALFNNSVIREYNFEKNVFSFLERHEIKYHLCSINVDIDFSEIFKKTDDDKHIEVYSLELDSNVVGYAIYMYIPIFDFMKNFSSRDFNSFNHNVDFQKNKFGVFLLGGGVPNEFFYKFIIKKLYGNHIKYPKHRLCYSFVESNFENWTSLIKSIGFSDVVSVTNRKKIHCIKPFEVLSNPILNEISRL